MIDLVGVDLPDSPGRGNAQYVARRDGAYLRGVDVSHHQVPGRVDLDGCDVLGVRVVYGARFDATRGGHVSAAMAANVPLIQAYGFYRQNNASGDEQAQAFIQACDGLPFNVVPCVDLEWNTAYDGPVDPEQHNTDGRAYVDAVAERFGGCMVYTAPFFWHDVLGAPDWVLDHDTWLAHYTGVPGTLRLPPRKLHNWVAHQYQGAPLDRSVLRCAPVLSTWST